jgi:hypothetical protein
MSPEGAAIHGPVRRETCLPAGSTGPKTCQPFGQFARRLAIPEPGSPKVASPGRPVLPKAFRPRSGLPGGVPSRRTPWPEGRMVLWIPCPKAWHPRTRFPEGRLARLTAAPEGALVPYRAARRPSDPAIDCPEAADLGIDPPEGLPSLGATGFWPALPANPGPESLPVRSAPGPRTRRLERDNRAENRPLQPENSRKFQFLVDSLSNVLWTTRKAAMPQRDGPG